MQGQEQVGLDHVYFIFADNCYENNLTDQSFRGEGDNLKCGKKLKCT